MGAEKHSENGKKFGEGAMSAALIEARQWANELERTERYRTDGTRESARHSIASKTGVPFSYLTRLRHKWREMNGVDGDAYRSLMFAYNRLCERVEAAADHQRFIREAIENGETINERAAPAGLGMAAPEAGESASKARVTHPETIEPKE